MPCACLFPRCTRGEEHKSPHPFLRELAEERQILVNPFRRIGPPSRVLKPWDVPSSLNHGDGEGAGARRQRRLRIYSDRAGALSGCKAPQQCGRMGLLPSAADRHVRAALWRRSEALVEPLLS